MIRPAAGADTHALRHQVLRPHQDPAQMAYPGDDDPTTGHFGAWDGDALIGVATVVHQPPPPVLHTLDPDRWWLLRGMATVVRQPPPPVLHTLDPDRWWRLRGMATAPDHRHQGVGSALLAAARAHVADRHGRGLWCNARVGAVAFYRRAGFVTAGAEWEEPGLGPHIVMWRAIP